MGGPALDLAVVERVECPVQDRQRRRRARARVHREHGEDLDDEVNRRRVRGGGREASVGEAADGDLATFSSDVSVLKHFSSDVSVLKHFQT